MDIVAVICIRDDQEYLDNCLNYLIGNNVSYAIIDNGLTEDSRALLEQPRFRKGLVSYSKLPFEGAFELQRQLEKKEEIIATLGADWVIHHDVDEIMHSYHPNETLSQAIERVHHDGCNVIAFDEFVFLPIEEEYQATNSGLPSLNWYYFHQRRTPDLMRARKHGCGLTTLLPMTDDGAGGHMLKGDIHLSNESFALRHYIVRNRKHALKKYVSRRFSTVEVIYGWHGDRIGYPPEAYDFPSCNLLHRLNSPESREFDRSNPQKTHYWEWSTAP